MMSDQAEPRQTILESDYPWQGTEAERWRFLLRYASLAPSERNTQPWLFQIQGYHTALYVELYADRTRAVHQVDPNERELILSCGAALFHLQLALRHFGYAGDVALFPDPGNPDLLARIRFGNKREATPGEQLLFANMQRRHTNRLPFSARSVSAALLQALELAVGDANAWLAVVEEDQRPVVADLVVQADRILFSRPEFRQELAEWIRDSGSNRPDGIDAHLFGMPEALTGNTTALTDNSDAAELFAERDYQLTLSAPALAVLGTRTDTPLDWLQTGQALAAILLRACAEGVSASFINTPVQVPELRRKLSEAVHREGYPQLAFRLGYGEEIQGTPRRDVGDVLINERPRE